MGRLTIVIEPNYKIELSGETYYIVGSDDTKRSMVRDGSRPNELMVMSDGIICTVGASFLPHAPVIYEFDGSEMYEACVARDDDFEDVTDLVWETLSGLNGVVGIGGYMAFTPEYKVDWLTYAFEGIDANKVTDYVIELVEHLDGETDDMEHGCYVRVNRVRIRHDGDIRAMEEDSYLFDDFMIVHGLSSTEVKFLYGLCKLMDDRIECGNEREEEAYRILFENG